MFRRVIALLSVLLVTYPARAEVPGLVVPTGFEITEFADEHLANDIYCLTVNPTGQVIVSGRGYIRLLVAEKGKATRAIDFANAPKDGAMGLCWDGDDLYCIGDGGLRRYRNASGDGKNRPSELLYPLKTGGEHAAHAVLRGPDGWLYVLGGDHTGITRKEASLPTSPIKDPIGGCLLRFPSDFKGCEIVADGFRNAYGMDFNRRGEFFTFDSDNERCVSLPWYEATRFYHVVPGGHYGWLAPQHAATWRMPPQFLDVVAPVVTLGRGSPTGVVCYRGKQFPETYREGMFLLDWTFGHIWFLKLNQTGSSYECQPEVFLRATGENGFAPTAAAVDPTTGDLYVSIGGRGTRGAVYRIRYPGNPAAATPPVPARSLELADQDKDLLLKAAAEQNLSMRLSALQQIERHHARFSASQLDAVTRSNLEESDRLVRQATARLLERIPKTDPVRVAEVFGSPQARLTLGLAEHGKALPDLIGNRKLSAELRVDAVRLLQLSLGDIGAPSAQGTVWEGYTCRRAGNPIDKATKSSLRQAFPSGHAVLDRELTRTLAMIEDDNDELARSVASRLTANSDPQADVHYLIVLSRLRAGITPEMVDRVAEALLCLDEKITQRKMVRESNWSARLGEMMPQLVRRYPNLNDILVQHPQFGRPDHALFAHTPGFNRAKAAERFWELSQQGDFVWDARLIGILAELPAEKGAQALRKLWGQVGQDEVILPLLARMPKPEDRERLLQGLNSGRLSVVQAAAEGLLKLPLHKERDELLAMVLALGRLPSGKEGDPVRKPLLELLQGNTGEKASDTDSWARWLAMTWPAIAPRLRNRDGVDVEAWEKRLKQVDWDKGEAERGLVVFRKASCAACHGGGQSIGPDLVGVGKRFSRTDLLTAILQPSKDVSPRYRTTLLTTSAGKTYQGLIVYEATDSVILQAGPSTTIRLTNAQITERHLTAQSLMPAGLLDRMSDGEIADLYVYLKSLR